MFGGSFSCVSSHSLSLVVAHPHDKFANKCTFSVLRNESLFVDLQPLATLQILIWFELYFLCQSVNY